MTAGMAAASPAAVVMRASEIPGATARRVAPPAVPRPWKASMMPQTVPNSPMNGVTAAVMASQGTLRSRREISSQGCAGSGELAFVFLISTFENPNQRARPKLIGNGCEILHALGFAEGAQEASTLHPGAAEQAPLSKNDGPRDQAEGRQGDEDEFGDRTCAGN